MAKVKNVSQGPRGVNTKDGSVRFIDPGETVDVEMSEGEITSSKRTGWFEFGGKAGSSSRSSAKPGDEETPVHDLTTADGLLAAADDSGVTYPDWRKAAKGYLGDSDPGGSAKKDDVIKAVEAKRAEENA